MDFAFGSSWQLQLTKGEQKKALPTWKELLYLKQKKCLVFVYQFLT